MALLPHRRIIIHAIVLSILLLPVVTWGQSVEEKASKNFIPLVGIPYIEGNKVQTFGDYVNALYFAAISIAAFLAVVRIIFAGVKYMLSDIVTTKEEARKEIKGALIGLLIVIGAVLILDTINPNLKTIRVFSDAPVPAVELKDNKKQQKPSGDLTDILKKNDQLYLISSLSYITDKNDCIKKYGRVIEGKWYERDKCLIQYEKRQQALDQFAADNCPPGESCRAELCEQQNTNFFVSCKQACKRRNSILFDPTISGCVFTNKKEIIAPITVDTQTKYYIKQNEDEIAGGYPKTEITIIDTNSTNGLVRVQTKDGKEMEISCAYIEPSVCNN